MLKRKNDFKKLMHIHNQIFPKMQTSMFLPFRRLDFLQNLKAIFAPFSKIVKRSTSIFFSSGRICDSKRINLRIAAAIGFSPCKSKAEIMDHQSFIPAAEDAFNVRKVRTKNLWLLKRWVAGTLRNS